ncbi:MAG: hypothetical protein WA177_19435 [Xanthobacteraceae bacterium]|jgi:hypothetical protein
MSSIEELREINAHRSCGRHVASMTHESPNPICPSCGKPMRLGRTLPRIGGLEEIRVYSCRPCGVALTEAGDAERVRCVIRDS